MMWQAMSPDEQKREMARLDYEYHRQETTDRLHIQEALGTGALKALVLINGGAIVALFTFLGNADADRISFDSDQVWVGFGLFVGGLVAAVCAQIAGYFMQARFGVATTHEMWNAQAKSLGAEPQYDATKPYRDGMVCQGFAIFLVVAALVAFCAGAATVLSGVAPA